ncbi:MAG: hypothetical protein H0W65_03860 [Sphingomonas sp.]|uniref:hypothetical protein n=1 Tax=Sphingomonas sp. TaxID=28214 RepID=UPI0017B6CDDD|nr:hypothetical protein [Sphingomonas sp.]MBA3666841.1 hypothetical protein [Sphingomonas sp.]
MIAALLLAAAATPTAIDAERAFAARAQKVGQWTAFREYAEPTAVMFTPQTVWAQDFLEGRKDPPRSVIWWPARSFVSCDSNLAVNTGPSRNAAGQNGYFTTVWSRQKDGGWKWSMDGGDTLKAPLARPVRPLVRRATCTGLARLRAVYAAITPSIERIAGKPPADAGQGRSADGTLSWSWTVAVNGARHFQAKQWNGRRYVTVLDQRVAAPPK